MAFSKIFTGSIFGIDANLVEVETYLDSRGFPGFTIVGLPGKEIDEAKERVRSAIKNSGYKFPDKKITVNLAPADLHKKGSLYDLPISVGVLSVANIINPVKLKSTYIIGELSLSGELYKVKGAFSLVLEATKSFERIIVPEGCLEEVLKIAPSKIFGFKTLFDVVNFIENGEYSKPKVLDAELKLVQNKSSNLFFKIVGQEFAKRAMQISAAGGHNLALYGPPGTGKSILAKAMPELLPPLNETEFFEVAKIHSVAGFPIDSKNLSRPFRNPHHTTTRIGITGGGNPVLPGEVSLAHNGVLFMDEFTEFSREVIESLRGPMEDHYINISRANGSYYLPSNFLLIAAFNPCACGNYGNPKVPCICAEHQLKRYRAKLSGPILDRIDIFVNCRPFDLSLLSVDEDNTHSSQNEFKKNISDAIRFQQNRYKGNSSIIFNRDLSLESFNKYINLSAEALDILNKYSNNMNLSARGYHRLAKVSRTIADLDLCDEIQKKHILEAAQYRLSL